ncbi:MAG: response regulator [Lentisphaeraceae bacterium]|nr:response regulator [Lentisphaeraceae bacterium]
MHGSHRKILVVEDSRLCQVFIRNELEVLGYEIIYAGTGQEALEFLSSDENIALVTLDMNLPDIPGMEVLEEVRVNGVKAAEFPDIVMLTGTDNEDIRLAGFEQGIINFVKKPFEPGSLRSICQNILDPSWQYAGLKVLVVDDCAFTCEIIKHCLNSLGVQTIVCHDGDEALSLLEQNPEGFDLIMMDLMMRHMNGDVLCRRIHFDLKVKDVPILLLSGKAETQEVMKLFKFGVSDYIHKPFSREELLARTEVHLQRRLYSTLMKKKVRELASISNMKDQYLAACTHDLRSPMAAIIGFIELMIDADDIKESYKCGLREVRKSADYLLGLIGDILDVGKSQTLNVKNFKPCDLVDICRTSLNTLKHLADRKSIVLNFNNECSQASVLGDEISLVRAVNNLFANAIKFTGHGGLVSLSVALEEGNAFLEVKDSGLGITPENQEHLFETYSDSSQGTAGETGTGLGLSITKGIIEAHGGTIEVISELGQGSCFTVSLPEQCV